MTAASGELAQRALRGLVAVAISMATVGPSSAVATDRIRIATLKTGTLSWELETLRAHDLDRQADLAIETTELASTEGGKIALKGGSVDLIVSDWLWVGRERAGRQSRILSVFERARRRNGGREFADQRYRRSEGQKARRCRRAARQKLAAAAGIGAAIGHRSQNGGRDRLRCAAAPYAKSLAGRDRSAVERAGLNSLNEGQVVEYEEVSNRGKTSAENLRVQR
jgi:hypothetical protein